MSYHFSPADQLHTGTIYHGPAPAPSVVRNPRVHDLRGDHDPYGATQTTDGIRTGDVLITDHVVGIMLEAWPVALHGDGTAEEFMHLPDDADTRWLGQSGWGRLFLGQRYFPVDGPPEGLAFDDFSAPRGGYDVSESILLAALIAATR